DSSCGAVVSFVGLVRDINQGEAVSGLTLEHYPGMTQKSLEAICTRAKARFEVPHIDVVHRVGSLALNEQIVFVGVAARHREKAFLACEYVMDHLKSEAPFWKKEQRQEGELWLAQNDKDTLALARWGESE
ncbi:molybdenum cofactor biosynthesis protein MoaE, partial [Pseudoalteromonas sp. T1lg75]